MVAEKKKMSGPGGGETGDDDAGAGPVNALGEIRVFNCGKSVRPKTFLYQKGKHFSFWVRKVIHAAGITPAVSVQPLSGSSLCVSLLAAFRAELGGSVTGESRSIPPSIQSFLVALKV